MLRVCRVFALFRPAARYIYAENDARIDATIPATCDSMKDAGKVYEPVIYAGRAALMVSRIFATNLGTLVIGSSSSSYSSAR